VWKLLQFSQFLTQSQIYSQELFEYVIPFNLHTTWCNLSILKCKKIGLYLLFLNIEQGCWSWSCWSSQWGGNGSVENGLNVKCYYINTISQTEGKCSPYLKGNTYSEGISCVIRCSLTAIQEIPIGQCHMTLSISSISIGMQLWKFSCECPFCSLTAKVFPLKSFAIYGILRV